MISCLAVFLGVAGAAIRSSVTFLVIPGRGITKMYGELFVCPGRNRESSFFFGFLKDSYH